MNESGSGRRPALLVLILLGSLGLALAAGCQREAGPLVNARPTVELTAAPEPGDTTAYRATLHWYGYDPDGYIDHYQYAIDVPPELQALLNEPGPTAIAWRDTTTLEGRFLFSATETDSIAGSGGTRVRANWNRGAHAFFVRAVDNHGDLSPVASVAFTSRNVLPESWIKSLDPRDGYPVVWGCITIDLCGWDPETSVSRSSCFRRYEVVPVLEWRLIRIGPIGTTENLDPDLAGVLAGTPEEEAPWHRLPGDVRSVGLSGLEAGMTYLFATRAVDEAGGTEFLFEPMRNAIYLRVRQAGESGSTPRLTVTERLIGVLEFPGDSVIGIEVPSNVPLRFEFNADATAYGGIVQGYNYGVDVADPRADGPASGFHGWSLSRFSDPITFTSAGAHTFTVKVRDTTCGVTVGTLALQVIPLTFDHEILLVDDFRRAISQRVTDAMMDERHRAMLQAAGFAPADIREYNAWGDQDQQADPTVPRLSDLAPYKMIAWSVLGTGMAGNLALVQSNACRTNRVLRAYVGGGGALWVFGQYTFAGFKTAGDETCLASLNYGFGDAGAPSHDFVPGDFLFDFMKIDGGGFLDAKNQVDTHGLVRAVPTARAVSEGYPELNVDRTIFILTNSGIPNCDAMFTPVYDNTDGLDTLYTYVSNKGSAYTGFNRKPTALRYQDPDPSPDQGPVAVFGFPVHLLQNGSASDTTGVQGMARLLVSWLRQHQSVAVASRGGRW